jgi:hypothetical protein
MPRRKRGKLGVLDTPEINNLFGTAVARAVLKVGQEEVTHADFHVLLKRFHISASQSTGAGKSFRNLFTPLDLYRLKLALLMSRQGFSSGLISDVLETCERDDFIDREGRPITESTLSLTIRDKPRKRWPNGDPEDLVWHDIHKQPADKAYFICDLAVIVKTVDKALEDIRRKEQEERQKKVGSQPRKD